PARARAPSFSPMAAQHFWIALAWRALTSASRCARSSSAAWAYHAKYWLREGADGLFPSGAEKGDGKKTKESGGSHTEVAPQPAMASRSIAKNRTSCGRDEESVAVVRSRATRSTLPVVSTSTSRVVKARDGCAARR